MKANDKIYVNYYLKELNKEVEHLEKFGRIKKNDCVKLNSKLLAEKCEVTQATISNLSTSSKFYLIHRICEEILDAYYAYFNYRENELRRICAADEDEMFFPFDISYIMHCLTDYYTCSWLFDGTDAFITII